MFEKYGKIRNFSFKSRYAFIVISRFGLIDFQEYDDYHSARDAVDRMDGKNIDGEKLIVEPTSKFILLID